MSIGQNTIWVVASIKHYGYGTALAHPDDSRRSIQFTSEEAAQRYMVGLPDAEGPYIIVMIPN